MDKKERIDLPLEIHHDFLRIIVLARIWNVYIFELNSFQANAYGTVRAYVIQNIWMRRMKKFSEKKNLLYVLRARTTHTWIGLNIMTNMASHWKKYIQ